MQKIDIKARHKARCFALQAIYQWQFTQDSANHILTQFQTEMDMHKADLEYFTELLKGVIAQVADIDEQMKPVLDRSVSGLNQVELAVLRIAIYELIHRIDVPYKVILNEALELTKMFGAAEGFKYVNGVLDKLARKLRTVEMQSLSG
jgi:N utilization substance protein B